MPLDDERHLDDDVGAEADQVLGLLEHALAVERRDLGADGPGLEGHDLRQHVVELAAGLGHQ
jgi:hypothetical protein